MNEKEIESLANRIIIKMMKIKTMENWMHDSKYTESAYESDYKGLEMTEEEEAIGEIAKLMTLKNLFEDKEQYEKCEIVKRRIQVVNDILKNTK